MPDSWLDESALAAFRQRTDALAAEGLQALADRLAEARELSQRSVEARAESEHQLALLLEGRQAESPVGD